MGDILVGLDVGSVSVSVAEVGPDGVLLRGATLRHRGDPVGVARQLLARLGGPGPEVVAATESTPAALPAAHRADNLVATVRAARVLHPGLGALLLVGGEKFSLSLFEAGGRYKGSRFNSLCAAGTGSFLDQQAQRLGLADSSELAGLARRAEGARPRIATRCAVFAKTDLIHAQQEGYDLPAICDGLCQGLAANVHDALFSGQPPPEPVVFAGGVARNQAVARHLQALLGCPLVVDEHCSLYGALGAALELGRVRRSEPAELPPPEAPRPAGVRGFYAPLALVRSTYPTRWSERSYVFTPRAATAPGPVEVDEYRAPARGARVPALLGIDVGSTSTKAVLLDPEGGGGPARAATGDEGLPVLAGFYTRTAGQPLVATQALLEAAVDWARAGGFELEVRAAGTTGSGRKFIGALLGADRVLDEITAHAEAAVALDPRVDTIIEIGGQDAKFTTLNAGTVTQSFMNQVCAAGTGSFIEEQARRLGCRLEDLSARTEGRRAPLASDRCTVFMERDINVFLAEGCAVDEALCAVLHAVRENYLLKVAREGQIGERVCFQGATAKNRSLVAAFEARLQKPIRVSRYCHLTGALGVALELRAQARAAGFETRFRGLGLHAERIPVRGEVCELCRNHCKLRVAEVGGARVTYGFLCGRDADTERFVSSNRAGFDLIKARRAHFRPEPLAEPPPARAVTVGLPAALHLVEDLTFWQDFFARLGVRTVTSEGLGEAVAQGKRLAGAEFCAPISAWHAHVSSLADKADWVFAPFYLEGERHDGRRHQYCYYTQYAPALVNTLRAPGLVERCLRPLVHAGERRFAGLGRLTAALRPALGKDLGRGEVERAWWQAEERIQEKRASWRGVMARVLEGRGDVAVVLLGRPYTLFVPEMNKGIPELFAAQGVPALEQDMLPPVDLGEVAGLIRKVHWRQAKRVLAAAERAARTPGLYPVLVTSFKCGPDACAIEYFRRIMHHHDKPYLILQLDEHDSQVGYETRVEAAVRAFRNHHAGAQPVAGQAKLPLVPAISKQLPPGRTLFVPAWDTLASPLFAAALQHNGIDARLIHEDAASVAASLGHNTGQCIPLNIIVHEFMQSVRAQGLAPADCALWMPQSSIGCNIGFFPQYAKALLETVGGGFEATQLYNGEIIAHEVSLSAAVDAYYAYLFGGMLRRMACRTRPYEVNAGETDRVVAELLELARLAVLDQRGKLETARGMVERFLAIPVRGDPRPKVALFGDLYARDNDVLNQDLVRAIERHGGEALTTPYTEYSRIIALPYLRKWLRERNYKDFFLASPLLGAVEVLERRFQREFQKVIGKPRVTRRFGRAEQVLARFGVRMQHTGESFDNLLKIFHLVERHPDIALFVQTNPAFCCPSLVTEAMAADIERVTGVPVVTVTYDGTAAQRNSVIYPYLDLAAKN